MKKRIAAFFFTMILFVIYLGFKTLSMQKIGICINEVRSTTASKDRDGYYGSDYIELYNGTEENISLDGWYMSDDESDLKKSRISEVIIPARSYAAIYADGKGDTGSSLNFKIGATGGKIFLSNCNGEIIDSVLIPELEFGEVYARKKNGLNQWAIMEESFLDDNAKAEIVSQRILEEPVFSHESGFYDEAFTLKLSCNLGETIYYTLDGSVPTKESETYKDGIYIENISNQENIIKAVRNVIMDWKDYYPPSEPVDKAVIVRAISMDDDGCSSGVVTNTYFVDLNQYRDQNVVSVVADYDELFGDEGILVTGKTYDENYLANESTESSPPNFTQSGRKWEVLGNLQLFCNGEEVCNQLSGIRAHGGSTRFGKIKRLSFFARKSYSGSEYFDGILMGERKVHSMCTNGNIGNLILQQLVTDRSVATQGAERTIIFLNGEYYNDQDLMERYTKQFYEQKYGIDGENLFVIKDGEVSEGPEEHILFYKWLQKQVNTKDLSISENYEKVTELMDIQSYIDYICANVYLCNMDVSEVKNYILWRTIEDDGTEFGDTRFRWMLYDMGDLDGTIPYSYYNVKNSAEINSFSQKGRYVGHSINEEEIYKALKKNTLYCRQFVLSFMDMANVNFAEENVEKIFLQWNFSTERFGDFFKKRFDYIVPYMAEEFNLSGTLENVTLKVNDSFGGIIRLNTTTPDLSKGSWTGKYYTDYPITVTAIPEDGYEFVGWCGSVTSDSATIEAEVLEGGITLEAVFEKLVD